ncbi:alpha/beta hydrolase [Bacillaceae bacterium S4-13-58]
MFYEEFGNIESKETVVFFNGVMTSTSSWYGYYPVFEKLGYRILLHDFKGQIGSDKPKGPYTFNEHAQDVKHLIDHLGIEKVHLVGTSYGSQVAMKFAVHHPEAVASLSIIDGASEIDETSRLFVEGWKYLAMQKKGEEFFWGAVPSLYFNDFVASNKPFLEERATSLNEIDESFFDGQTYLYDTFVQDSNFTEELEKIQCPSLVIWGEQDLLTPRKFSEILVENIADTEFVVVPNSGHVTIFEQLETVRTLMLGFVVKHSSIF